MEKKKNIVKPKKKKSSAPKLPIEKIEERKKGGQVFNKNAETWTEEKALIVGQDLINWMIEKDPNDPTNKVYYQRTFFQEYLLENGFSRNMTNYLANKFTSFRELLKIAKEIQEIKIKKGGLHGVYERLNSMFLQKVIYGRNENQTQKDYDFENDTDEEDFSRLLTRAEGTTCVYVKNVEAVYKNYRIISNKGSSRSSKTRSLIDLHLDWLITGKFAGREIRGNAGVFQKSLPFLKKNLLEDILKVIRDRNIKFGQDIIWHQTECYFQKGDRKWFYGSLNNESEIGKVKGLGLGLIWFNEAHDIRYEAFKQLNMRATENPIFILDHNPENENSWVKLEIEEKRKELIGDVCVIHSTYLDNRFLPQSTVQEIENFKLTDPDWYNIYGLGQYGTLKGRIFPEYKEYDQLPRARFIKFFGQDFGYSNSKDALLEINWKRNSNELYIKSHIYRTGILPNNLSNEVAEIVGSETVFADHAEARMIGDERNHGINVLGTNKDIKREIELVKCFDLYIHSEDINSQNEIKLYRWAKDPNNDQNFLNIPLKGHNIHEHLMKCLQYAVKGAIDTNLIPMPKGREK